MDIFLAGVIVGIVGAGMVYFAFFVWRKNGRKGKGLKEMNEEQAREKKENVKKVLDYFSGRERVSNNDIENLLGISDATAERYLQELEKQGRIKQVGEAGKYVYYQSTTP
jgi:predicted HTH transcriptional regulator